MNKRGKTATTKQQLVNSSKSSVFQQQSLIIMSAILRLSHFLQIQFSSYFCLTSIFTELFAQQWYTLHFCFVCFPFNLQIWPGKGAAMLVPSLRMKCKKGRHVTYLILSLHMPCLGCFNLFELSLTFRASVALLHACSNSSAFNSKTHGFGTFSHFGHHIWNNLPQDLRHSTTLFSFKGKLKTFLFSEYFS